MDKKLWREATKSLRRIRAEYCICFALMLLGAVGMFISLAFPDLLGPSVVLCVIGMFAGLIPTGREAKLNPYGHKLPKTRKVTADNPAVLEIVLSYLKQQVLAPKEQFVKGVKNCVDALQTQLDAFEKDALELQQNLANAQDEQMKTISQSAILRVCQIYPLLGQRKRKLEAQIQEAEAVVRPIVVQIEQLQAHLNRITRDKRVAESLKMIYKIDLHIPINDQFLESLRFMAVRAKSQLDELVADTKAEQAAWAEVRLDSTLSPENEVRLNS
ncbi:MAG: hypothetical protein Q8Q05_03595 [bacterium]|nr:hypothetical protein [bacterium]